MSEMKVIPNVIVQKFLTGNDITGVAPSGAAVEFAFNTEVGGPFTVGESLTWTASTGKLLSVDSDGVEGTIVAAVLSGNAPTNGQTVTGTSSGATCVVDGSSSDTQDSAETIQRGRYLEYFGLVDGGLVDLPDSLDAEGFTLVNVRVSLPGITAVEFVVVDSSGDEFSAGSISLTLGRGYTEWRNGGLLVPPNCSLKAVGTGTLSSAGQLMFVLGKGWGQNFFTNIGGLGTSDVPPAMIR